MSGKTLEQLKVELSAIFTDAAAKSRYLFQFSNASEVNAGAQAGLMAIEAAKTLVLIEREQREAGEQKVRILPKQ